MFTCCERVFLEDTRALKFLQHSRGPSIDDTRALKDEPGRREKESSFKRERD